jgi:hypothetical protein
VYNYPKEMPEAMLDGECHRMPKILVRGGKRPRYAHPRISTMTQCPILADGKEILDVWH